MTADPPDPALLAALERALRDADVPGAAVALRVDGRPVLDAGVGFQDLARTQPLPAGARFSAYSIAKPLLAAACLRLAELGQLDLDAPLRDLLPDLVPALDPGATLRRALNHTAGLPDYGALPTYKADLRADPARPWTVAEFLSRTLPHGPLFPPGGGWAYSNVGYLLVRLVLERRTGGSLRDALAALLFAPLGLRETTVAETLADVQDLTPGHSTYLDGGDPPRDVGRRYHPGWVAHGLVVSTAGELARLFDALFAGRLLGPASLVPMLDAVEVPEPHPLFARPAYGLGLMVDLASPWGRVAGHAGGGPGYSTAALHAPDLAGRRAVAVALANTDHGDHGLDLAFALLRAAADRPLLP